MVERDGQERVPSSLSLSFINAVQSSLTLRGKKEKKKSVKGDGEKGFGDGEREREVRVDSSLGFFISSFFPPSFFILLSVCFFLGLSGSNVNGLVGFGSGVMKGKKRCLKAKKGCHS